MTKPKSILFLAQLPPPHHGQSAMAEAVHGIFREKAGATVKHIWRGGAAGATDVGKRTLSKYLQFARMVGELSAMAVTGKRFDVAYLGMAPWAHTITRDAILIAMAKLLAKRVWVHVHGQGLERFSAPTGFTDTLVSKCLANTEIIAITDESSTEAERSGIFARVAHIPNFANDPGTLQKGVGGPLHLCTLGNLDPRKGIHEFLATMVTLKEQGIDIRGTMIGGPTQLMSVEDARGRVVELGLERQVTVTGWMDDEEKSRLLGKADIFLYPSRHDLAPLALIEAIAHGCVPIVFNTGGIPDIVGPELGANCIDAGISNDAFVREAGKRVAEYHKNRDRLARHSKQAREHFDASYSKSKFNASILALLNETPVANNLTRAHTPTAPLEQTP